MKSIKDIKILLFVGYAFAYVLSVFAPIVIDPILKSHVLFQQPRHYPYAVLCIPIYVVLLAVEFYVLRKSKNDKSLYLSVAVFIAAILLTFPIFLPEFPHGNIFAVGATTAFLSAFSVFVWSISNKIMIDDKLLSSANVNTLEYIKTLFAFVRQGAFAGVALFGALFFASYTTGLKFIEAVATEKSDVFLLNSNVNVQIAFYAIYSVAGPIRYFFASSMRILGQFREIAERLDHKMASKHRKRARAD